MKTLFTEQEHDLSKRTDLLPLECYYCHQKFFKSKHDIDKAKNGNRYVEQECRYCSEKCGDLEFSAKFEKTFAKLFEKNKR